MCYISMNLNILFCILTWREGVEKLCFYDLQIVLGTYSLHMCLSPHMFIFYFTYRKGHFSVLLLILFSFLNFILFLKFTILYFAKYRNESATGIHVFPILNTPPSSLPIPSLWVVPVHQPQASSIMHRTWTGNSFHI